MDFSNECYEEHAHNTHTLEVLMSRVSENDLWICRSFMMLFGSFVFFTLVGAI